MNHINHDTKNNRTYKDSLFRKLFGEKIGLSLEVVKELHQECAVVE
ncbi:MAG: hypothetical protein IJ419_03515 [Agathobacter sp.]|nr:hypothetical protein [Agathobacter sp.]